MWLEATCGKSPDEAAFSGGAGASDHHTPSSPRSGRAFANSQIDTLYRQEAAALRLFVSRTLRSTADCEDIVQDAFVRTWRAVAEGRARSARAVLFRTARNLAFNHIRNTRARTSVSTRAAVIDTYVRPQATAEEHLLEAEKAASCQRLLDGLPARCREAFVLRVVDELSYQDMSNVMQLSVSTIEKHVGKGKQMCRAQLMAAQTDGDPVLGVLLSGTQDFARNARKIDDAMRMAAE